MYKRQDFRDASRVWVHTLDGELIGEAVLGGNASPAMPQSLMDKATEKREKGQLARLVKKAKTVTGQDVELRVVPKGAQSAELTEQQLEDAREYAALTLERPAPTFTVPDNDMTRYDLWQELEARRQRGEVLSEAEANWHAIYPNNPGFKAIQRMYDHFAAAEATA